MNLKSIILSFVLIFGLSSISHAKVCELWKGAYPLDAVLESKYTNCNFKGQMTIYYEKGSYHARLDSFTNTSWVKPQCSMIANVAANNLTLKDATCSDDGKITISTKLPPINIKVTTLPAINTTLEGTVTDAIIILYFENEGGRITITVKKN